MENKSKHNRLSHSTSFLRYFMVETKILTVSYIVTNLCRRHTLNNQEKKIKRVEDLNGCNLLHSVEMVKLNASKLNK